MQTAELLDLKDTIFGVIMANFIQEVCSSDTLSGVEAATLQMVNAALTLVLPGKKVVDLLPQQQNSEETKSIIPSKQLVEVRGYPESDDIFKVPYTMLISEVKTLIEEKSGYPTKHQMLYLDDQILDDSRSIESYGISNDYNIDLRLRDFNRKRDYCDICRYLIRIVIDVDKHATLELGVENNATVETVMEMMY